MEIGADSVDSGCAWVVLPGTACGGGTAGWAASVGFGASMGTEEAGMSAGGLAGALVVDKDGAAGAEAADDSVVVPAARLCRSSSSCSDMRIACQSRTMS